MHKDTEMALQGNDATIQRIAQNTLRIETLETRNSDQLDFHDISVWMLRAALEEAFQSGRNSK